jgi:hypothetical protein
MVWWKAVIIALALLFSTRSFAQDDKASQLQAQYANGGNGRSDAIPRTGFSDPTSLTTQQLDRAIVDLRVELSTRIESLEKAVALAHDDLVRVPTTVDKAVGALKDLLEERIDKNEKVSFEKFVGVNSQFVERDKRADLLSAEQKDAGDKLSAQNAANIAAALIGQKDTADKSEKALLDAIAQQRQLSQSEFTSINTQINDLKSRLDKSEGHVTGTGDTYGWIFGFVMAAASFLAIIFLIFDRRRASRVD